MNTPSHFIMTAALKKALPAVPIVGTAFLIGSVAPDIPLYLLSLGGIVYFHYGLGWSGSETAEHMYGTLYFENPGWIGFHNVFHSFVVILAGIVLARIIRQRRPRLSAWIHWFLVACCLHTVVDIFTHGDDGPVFLWPLSQTFRFYSPVSYWDPNFYGRQFAIFELLFDAALIGYLVLPWLRRRFGAASAQVPATDEDSP